VLRGFRRRSYSEGGHQEDRQLSGPEVTVRKGEPMAHRTHSRIHPHAEGTYRVITSAGGGVAVEVRIPGTYPAKVSPFATEADAEA